MSEINVFEKSKREVVRWRILKTLYIGRPIGAPESIIFETLLGSGLAVTNLQLRQELDYLRDRKLLVLSNEHTAEWHAELTRYGVDLVEYTVDCKPGIARPPQV